MFNKIAMILCNVTQVQLLLWLRPTAPPNCTLLVLNRDLVDLQEVTNNKLQIKYETEMDSCWQT